MHPNILASHTSTHTFTMIRHAARTVTAHATFPLVKVFFFTALLTLSALIGKIPLPGNLVGVTLQTFVLMILGLSLSPSQAASSVTTYLTLGAVGLPVFSGGVSTAALLGPSAGYLYAFLPAVVITSMLHTYFKQHLAGGDISAVRFVWFVAVFSAAFVGCVVIPLALGIPLQASFTGLPLSATLVACIPFAIVDTVKALLAAGLLILLRKHH